MKRIKTIAASLAIAALFIGCGKADTDEVSSEDRERITEEIKQRVAQYVEDVQALDFQSIMSFWSDSEEFVFAGDGKILGGYETWAEGVKQFTEETESVPVWDNKKIHVIVLSKETAACTFEFDITNKLRNGKTVMRKGAWTYVFQNYDGVWKVIATNGTHLDQEFD